LNDGLRLAEPNSAAWIELSMSLADVLRKTEKYEESQKLYLIVLKVGGLFLCSVVFVMRFNTRLPKSILVASQIKWLLV
jgi:hypothetical protein